MYKWVFRCLSRDPRIYIYRVRVAQYTCVPWAIYTRGYDEFSCSIEENLKLKSQNLLGSHILNLANQKQNKKKCIVKDVLDRNSMLKKKSLVKLSTAPHIR